MPSLVDKTLIQHLIPYIQGRRSDNLMLINRYRRLCDMVLELSPRLDEAIQRDPEAHEAALHDLLLQLEQTSAEARKVLRGLKQDIQNTASNLPPQPLALPILPKQNIQLKLQLTEHNAQVLEVRLVESPQGEAVAYSRLPYTPLVLAGILKALQSPAYRPDDFSLEQKNAFQQMGLLQNYDFVPDILERVGQHLYDTLMVGDIAHAFHTAVTLSLGMPVPLQLRFDEFAAHVARFPWELLHDHRTHLVADGTIDLTRYLSYPKPQPSLILQPPLRILYIEARPTDRPYLPIGEEQEIVRAQICGLADAQIDVITPPTYQAFVDKLRSQTYQIVHFDGHGSFDRRCPRCQTRNFPHYTQCQNVQCRRTLENVPARGFLAFEQATLERHTEWVPSQVLGALLSGTGVVLAVLSACQSSMVRDPGMVNGVAPALIQAGVPAVVAMQLPVSAYTARTFIQNLYTGIVHGESIGQAFLWGRKHLLQEREWFVPTLYVRTRGSVSRFARWHPDHAWRDRASRSDGRR